jgi:hypothetical protein
MSKRKAYSRRGRGFHDRKTDYKDVRQRFLIVCEGAKTEPNYFRSFKFLLINVMEIEIKGVGEDPSTLVNSAKDLNEREESDYDQVWCVFDRDDVPLEKFNNAIKKAENQGFKVAYSNEAFELWYVLHFEYLDTGISRNDYCDKLNNLLKGGYEKNSEEIYDELIDKQTTAIKHAKTLLKQYSPLNPGRDNPSTTVHLLVEELNKFIQ